MPEIKRDTIESGKLFYEQLQPFVSSKIITGLSTGPTEAVVELLKGCEFEISWLKNIGPKTILVENLPVHIIYSSMKTTHGSSFLSGDDDTGAISYANLVMTVAKLLGAGKKEAPFIEPAPALQFLMEWYLKEIKRILDENHAFPQIPEGEEDVSI